MLSYYLKCRKKKTESKKPKCCENKTERIILLLKCEVLNSKKPKFIKEVESSRLLSS